MTTEGRAPREQTTPLYVIRKGRDAEAAWLKAHGFDGLACMVMDCGCWRDDLYPCGERGDKFACMAGHEAPDGVGIYRLRPPV